MVTFIREHFRLYLVPFINSKLISKQGDGVTQYPNVNDTTIMQLTVYRGGQKSSISQIRPKWARDFEGALINGSSHKCSKNNPMFMDETSFFALLKLPYDKKQMCPSKELIKLISCKSIFFLSRETILNEQSS